MRRYLLSHAEICFTLKPPEIKDWSKVTMETDPCVGITRRALSDVLEKIKGDVNRLSKAGEYYSVTVSLSIPKSVLEDRCPAGFGCFPPSTHPDSSDCVINRHVLTLMTR